MSTLSASSKPIDTVTLCEELQRDNSLEAVGGITYVGKLFDGTPEVSNVEHYTQIIKEKSLLRKLIHSAHDILIRGYSAEEDAAELLESAEKAVFDLGQERIKSGFVGLNQLLSTTWRHIESVSQRNELITGIATGFTDLDNKMSGLQPSDLIVLAARPGLGKTSLALNMAQHAAP